VPLLTASARSVPGLDVLDRRAGGGEHDLHLPAEQVGQCLRLAPVRHVGDLDVGHHVEQLAGNMAGGADAA